VSFVRSIEWIVRLTVEEEDLLTEAAKRDGQPRAGWLRARALRLAGIVQSAPARRVRGLASRCKAEARGASEQTALLRCRTVRLRVDPDEATIIDDGMADLQARFRVNSLDVPQLTRSDFLRLAAWN
jgi:hypothetical protein